MSEDVGRHARADVVVVAEQLRRGVPGGIGTYVSGLLTGFGRAWPQRATGDIPSLRSRVRGPDPLDRFGFPVSTIAIPSRLPSQKAWDLGLGRVRANGLVHATSFALPPSAAKVVMMVHDLAFLTYPEAYPDPRAQVASRGAPPLRSTMSPRSSCLPSAWPNSLPEREPIRR